MLTPRERLLKCLRKEPVDRVPLMLESLVYQSQEELLNEPDSLKREVCERICDESHYRYQIPSMINRYLITPPQFIEVVKKETHGENEVVTSEIRTPRGALVCRKGRNPSSRTSWEIKYPVENLEDIKTLRSLQWELPEGLKDPGAVELPESFSRRGILATGVSSPFVCVAAMMPYEYFLELCVTEFSLIKELTEICTERTLAILDQLLASRAIEYVWMGGCEWLTPPMGSPRLYEELVQPFEQKIIRRIHAGGALAHVHCHGNVRSTLDHIIARGADFTEPVEPPPDGDITFAEAKKQAAGRVVLGGNVEARVLEKGTVAETEAATRAAFEGGQENMILCSTAGPISKFDKQMQANYHKLIDIWEELSSCDAEKPVACAAAG